VVNFILINVYGQQYISMSKIVEEY